MACPYISVLTVSMGRRNELLRKAGALAEQTFPPDRFEWVVCLNGGDAQGAGAALEALALPFAVRLFETVERLPAAAARNACAQRTCGSVLLFSDDDCLPGPADLAAHVAEQERGLCAALGGIRFEGGASETTWSPRRVGYWHLNGANSSVPAATFRAVGGFDEALTGYGGEDLELGYRLAAYGLPFHSLPAAQAVHLGPDPREGADLAKARAAGLNAARLSRLHPPLRWRLGLHPLQVTVKRLLFAVRLGGWLERLGGGSVGYERAYLEGALESRKTTVEESA